MNDLVLENEKLKRELNTFRNLKNVDGKIYSLKKENEELRQALNKAKLLEDDSLRMSVDTLERRLENARNEFIELTKIYRDTVIENEELKEKIVSLTSARNLYKGRNESIKNLDLGEHLSGFVVTSFEKDTEE